MYYIVLPLNINYFDQTNTAALKIQSKKSKIKYKSKLKKQKWREKIGQ